jgi:hypothetical protein
MTCRQIWKLCAAHSSLPLLMLRVAADHANDTTPPDDLALLTASFHRRFDLHPTPPKYADPSSRAASYLIAPD